MQEKIYFKQYDIKYIFLQLINETSSKQNLLLQVGQGHFELNQVSGRFLSCLIANHFPRQVKHHIGLQ
jgi:hypothetical protein